jgi:hypothetical protein
MVTTVITAIMVTTIMAACISRLAFSPIE